MWLPIKSSYLASDKSLYPPEYVTLINHSTKDDFPPLSLEYSKEECQSQLNTLSLFFNEWAPELFDKIFSLLEAQEAAVKHSPISPVISAIHLCVALFFQALDVNDPLRVPLEDKILEYFTKSTPINSAKASAKIIESIVSTNPNRLNVFLSKILSPEVLSDSYSAEKLSFRIRLASGAVRQSQGKFIFDESNLKLILGIINSQVFEFFLIDF
jgi:hypothetical protein